MMRMKLLLYKVLMVIIIVGNPDSSNEIYISIEKDKYGGDHVVAINRHEHEHINKRHANSAAASSKRIRLSKELDLKVVCFYLFFWISVECIMMKIYI